MPDIGRTTVGVNTRGINSLGCNGLRITMTEAGAAGVTITAYIEDTATGDQFRACVIDDADKSVVVASSNIRTNISTAGWYTFSGGSLATFTPANATAYVIGVLSDSAAGAVIYEDDIGADGYAGQASAIDPLAFTFDMEPDVNRDFSIYMTYTAAGGSGRSRNIGGKLVGGTLVTRL